jgi:hypothetical protein
LSPALSVSKHTDRGSHFLGTCPVCLIILIIEPACLATIPSVSDAVDALSGFCSALSSTLQQILEISAELEGREHIRVESIQEVSFMR